MCKLNRLLVTLAPLPSWKGRILAAHIARCPRCAEAQRFESRSLEAYLKPDWIESTPSCWLGVRGTMVADASVGRTASQRRPSRPRAFRRGMAWGAATALILAGIGIFQIVERRRSATIAAEASVAAPAAEDGGLSVRAQTLHGKPARVFYYQTKHASYVWITPSKENGV